jgi:hypothetical protein
LQCCGSGINKRDIYLTSVLGNHKDYGPGDVPSRAPKSESKNSFKIQKGFHPIFVEASDPSLAGLLIIWINTQENMRTLIFRIKDWKAL